MSQLPPTAQYPQYNPLGEPPPKSRKGLWIGLGIAAAVLLCLGGAGVVAAVYILDARTTTGPATPATHQAEAPSHAPELKVTLSLPDTIGSRSKNSDPTLNKAIDDSKKQLASLQGNGIGEPVGGFYGSAPKQDLLMVYAFPSTAVLSNQFDLMFDMMGRSTGGTVGASKSVDAGPLGGKAKCVDLDIQGTPVAYCGWSEDASAGFVFFYFTKVDKAEKEFATVRGLIEHQG